MHRRQDALFPFAIGQKIAAGIRNARFLPLEGDIHYHALGDSEAVLNAMLAFLAEDAPKPAPKASAPPDSAFRAVLFTDLVGHTEMMSRLGDDRGRDVLREHERITREVLKANGGTEVKTMGDGFMASFGSVTKAVECAVALQRAFAEHVGEALNVRVGLNAGEPIEEDGDLFGATVILASRIAAKAAGGEILVADTVRGLCSGKGFLFADRGEFVAKGFEEPVRVYQVSWRM
ncbi:MAG: adenylate/guanylate cyclase domain-containing protein [Dehalococcoidia bacterium]